MALDLIIESIHQEIAKRGYPTDKTFDALFPTEIRKLSVEFWSSTAVSLKVANFLCEGEQEGQTVPKFIVKVFEGYLRCGIHAHGFARLHCGNAR